MGIIRRAHVGLARPIFPLILCAVSKNDVRTKHKWVAEGLDVVGQKLAAAQKRNFG